MTHDNTRHMTRHMATHGTWQHITHDDTQHMTTHDTWHMATHGTWQHMIDDNTWHTTTRHITTQHMWQHITHNADIDAVMVSNWSEQRPWICLIASVSVGDNPIHRGKSAISWKLFENMLTFTENSRWELAKSFKFDRPYASTAAADSHCLATLTVSRPWKLCECAVKHDQRCA